MSRLFIGLISGTSADAVDAVLADFHSHPPQILERHEYPLPEPLRQGLLAFHHSGPRELDRLARLDNAVARLFAEAVTVLLERARVDPATITAIGSHGQTIRHEPDGHEPYSVQIGNPSLLAELTGIAVVADFRRRDMAAGGQGAPLAPAFHNAFFRSTAVERAVVNIGGIANITLLPADPLAEVIGFDTGPGNALLDAWAERHLHTPLDRDGAWAASGRVIPELLAQLLEEAYFQRQPPKSTGRELFQLNWLEARLNMVAATPPADVQATLTALTAHTIAAALRQYAPATQELLVCGGGARNPVVMTALRTQLESIGVQPTSSLGIDPDYLEALGFAWLAWRTWCGQPGNLPSVTGARGARVLGGIYPA